MIQSSKKLGLEPRWRHGFEDGRGDEVSCSCGPEGGRRAPSPCPRMAGHRDGGLLMGAELLESFLNQNTVFTGNSRVPKAIDLSNKVIDVTDRGT